MCMVQTTVLMVGAGDKEHAMRALPIRLILLDTGIESVRALRDYAPDILISKWDLVDIPDGKLLENVIAAVPGMPTIALIEPGNLAQEIKATQLGVTAILSDDVDDDFFCQVVSQLLGSEALAAVRPLESGEY